MDLSLGDRIMREFNGTEPVFEATEDYLKTTLYNNGPKNGLDDPKDQAIDPKSWESGPKNQENDPNNALNDLKHGPKASILTLMTQNPTITYNELAASVNKSTSTVKRYIQELKADGTISRIGGTKGGWWVVK